MVKKGIVISPPFKVLPEGGVTCGGSPDAQDIRKYLLYWDEIDYPSNNNIFIELSDDLAFLQNCNVLKRTHAVLNDAHIDPFVFITAQEQAFKENEAAEKGKWSLAQLSDTQFYTNTIPEIGIEFELRKCLSVPEKDVPLNDILEFKQKRESELIALRIYLDELYQSIIIARDIPRAKNAALNKLELALKDIDKSIDDFSIRKAITSLRGTIAVNVTLPIDVLYAMPVLGISVSVSFATKPLLFPQSTNVENPLTYIKSIKKDLG